jgi:hypothetical protein
MADVRKPEVQRQSVAPAVEKNVVTPISEEMVIVGLFEGMVKKVDEIYIAALEIESTPQLAKLLGEVGIVKATLGQIISKLKEDEEIRKATEVFAMKQEVERELERNG